MRKHSRITWSICFAMMNVHVSVVSCQIYPSKPIRIITGSVGGGQEFATRIIAQGISGALGQPVITDPRGVSVAISGDFVARAPADGYTLLLVGNNLWIGPLLEKLPYDPVRDFAPITMVASTPNILVVHPSLPVKTVQELIDFAKTRPGELNYGSSGFGTSTHLAGELFKAMAGVNIVRIPYKGGGPSLNALISGEVQIWFPNAAAVTQHLKSGKLRALAVTSSRPTELAPGLPTVAASGLPGYESVLIIGVLAPATTPVAIIERLNHEIVGLLNRADVKRKLFDSGAEVVGSSPEQFAGAIKSEMARLAKVIKDAGIHED